MFTSCKIVFKHQLIAHFPKYANLINDKDLEQLVAVRELGIKYLVSYDKHFQGCKEYKTPKQFVTILGLEVYPTDY